MGAKGKVTSLLQKRDKVLAVAIQNAVARNLPLDSLSSRKKDYDLGGRLASSVMGKPVVKKAGNHHSKYLSNKRRSSSGEGSGSRSSGGPGSSSSRFRGGGGRSRGRA